MLLKRAAVVVSISIALSSCGATRPPTDESEQSVATTVLQNVDADEIIWLTADEMMLFRGGAEPAIISLSVLTGSSKVVRLPGRAEKAPGDDRQSGWDYPSNPVVMPGRRLGLVRAHWDGTRSEFVAVDTENSTVEIVASLNFVDPPPGTMTNFFWRTDLSAAYVTVRGFSTDRQCSTIVRVQNDEWAPMDIDLDAASVDGWNLAETAGSMRHGCGPQTGEARAIGLTAGDSPSLLVYATPSSAVTPSNDTVGNIYSVEIGSRRPEVLVRDATVGGSSLSPDGSQLAWNGKFKDGSWGCWVYSLTDSESVLVSSEIY